MQALVGLKKVTDFKTALFYASLEFFCTHKLGCKSSKAVGVHTPRTSRSIIFINPPPLPFTRPKELQL